MKPIAARRALFASLLLALAVATGSAADTTPVPSAPGVGSYLSAKKCASCHQTIHTYWSESAHAHSASHPVYLEALNAVPPGTTDDQGARRACLWCHAPAAIASGDYDLKQAITQEGVTCDFCHTVADVDLEKKGHPFELRPGPVKFGPLQYAKSPFHETAYSPLHKASALLCAACHEHKNALGVSVLSTYSEWRESPYPSRGMLCQECHMPLVPGDTVREGPKSTRVINLHRMVGGSADSQLRRGLDVKIDSLTVTSVSAEVQVLVTNTRVGHAAPGGLSTKALVLAVGIEDASGQLRHLRERTYRRDLLDGQGRVLATVPDLFLKAASVGEDTRLKPKESRSERFTVPLVEGARAIVARVEYRDASDPKAAPKTMLVVEERKPLSSAGR
jgi:Cytochrome c554 and c-prime